VINRLPDGGGGAAGPDATTSAAKPIALISFEILFVVFDRNLSAQGAIVFFTGRDSTLHKLQIYEDYLNNV
jgi:hypothetical protein